MIGIKVRVVNPRITQEAFLKGKVGVIESVATVKELEDKGIDYPRLIVSFFSGEYVTAMHHDELLAVK